MKKHVFLSIFLFMMLFLTTPCFADSPVTSTNFHAAYMDLEIVQKAKLGTVNSEIAAYLSSKSNPIDVKAAVINALGWDFEGKNNAETYSGLIYKKPVRELNLESLSGEELFCIGYMTAMDDYFNPEKAIPLLKKATAKVPDSFTVSLVSSIVQGQEAMHNADDWNAVWEPVSDVVSNNKLQRELRTEASRIIIDYMSAYSDYPVINPFAYENKVFFYLDDPELAVNDNNYEIDFGRGTKPELKSGRTFLPISPLVLAMGGTTDWDGKESKVTIKLDSKTLELWIGRKSAIVDGAVKQLDAAPYVSNSRTMLPLRFITENLGCQVGWNGEINEITVTIPNPQYKATAEELWSVGSDLLTWGNYELADDYFSRALKIKADYADAYVGKAVVIVWIGDDWEALELCRKALSMDPKNAGAYNAMAMAYRNLEMYEESLDSCNKAIELKPDFADAYNHKGNALYLMGRYNEAIQNYDLAIKNDPTMFNAYNSKGNALYGLGRYEESIKYYDKALEIDPSYAETYYNKGTSLYLLGRFESAIEAFDECLEWDSEYAYAYYWKAGALVNLGKTDAALSELKSAFEIDEELKSVAVTDETFKDLRNNQTFLELVR